MATNANIEQEGTDLNEKIQNATKIQPENAEVSPSKKPFQLNDKQKAAAIMGTVLLGGAAFVAVSQTGDGTPIEPETPQTPLADTTSNLNNLAAPTDSTAAPADSTAVTTPPKIGEVQAVAGGTINPSENIQIATNVNDQMTFGDAFSTAREEVGQGGIFNWHGNTYNTFYREEWNTMPLAGKQEFLHEVGFKMETPKAKQQNPEKAEQENPESEPPQEPDYGDIIETTLNGKPVYAFDHDRDGMADTIIMVDDANNQTYVMLDEEGNNQIVSVTTFDSTTMEVIETNRLSEPFDAPMEEIAQINQTVEPEEEVLPVDTTQTIEVDSVEVDSAAVDSTAVSAEQEEGYSNNENVEDIAAEQDDSF